MVTFLPSPAVLTDCGWGRMEIPLRSLCLLAEWCGCKGITPPFRPTQEDGISSTNKWRCRHAVWKRYEWMATYNFSVEGD
ncbi:MAG: hypothetical protein J5644_01910 [Bacteroidales bacterium]|nr:hypothetical protein [Bacteroidales bacterium]